MKSVIGLMHSRRAPMGLAMRKLTREAILARCTPLAAKCLQNEWERREALPQTLQRYARRARSTSRAA